MPGLLVELLERLAELLVDRRRRRTCPARSATLLEQRVQHLLVGLAARELLIASRASSRNSSSHLAARAADQVEALRQRALVGEVVDGGQQLALREVAACAEDHQRRRVDGQALEPLDERVLADAPASCAVAISRLRPAPCARPRGRRTGCAARRAPSPRTRSGRASRSARTATP